MDFFVLNPETLISNFNFNPSAEEEVNKFYEGMVAKIREAMPDFEGAITVEESVRDQLALISRVTIADSGSFLERTGKEPV